MPALAGDSEGDGFAEDTCVAGGVVAGFVAAWDGGACVDGVTDTVGDGVVVAVGLDVVVATLEGGGALSPLAVPWAQPPVANSAAPTATEVIGRARPGNLW